MSVEEQITRIKTNIANTYTAAQSKGATMPQTQNSDNLAACVQSITTGGGGGTQFGLTAEQMLGMLDGEGNLTLPTLPSITFAGVKNIPNNGYSRKFSSRTFESNATISFPDLTYVYPNGLEYCFQAALSIYSADLSSLITADKQSLNFCFGNISALTSVDLSSLVTVDVQGLSYCFYGCGLLTSVDLSSLSTVGTQGMGNCFASCTSLTSVSFPSLTSVQTNSFGSASYNYCFADCTALTEIHFRADMQATIEAMTGYADKFGATNATLYFSL